jgi:hypothetical protein
VGFLEQEEIFGRAIGKMADAAEKKAQEGRDITITRRNTQ